MCIRDRCVWACFQHVTCGSVLKLVHTQSNYRLHSHDVKYGSGSGQQSVTGVSQADDVNSYWVVRGPHGESCQRGDSVKCNSVIRLQHLSTQLFLHSHKFTSPLSGNQEVSAFGNGGKGDRGDNWIVDCNDSSEYWNRDDLVRFKHKDTGKFLHSSGHSYGRPIAGQREISAYGNAGNQNNLWTAMEGVYMEPNSENL